MKNVFLSKTILNLKKTPDFCYNLVQVVYWPYSISLPEFQNNLLYSGCEILNSYPIEITLDCIVSFLAYPVDQNMSMFSRAYIANRVTDKLTKVTDRIYCCRSGSAADTQAIADIVNYHLNFYQWVKIHVTILWTVFFVSNQTGYTAVGPGRPRTRKPSPTLSTIISTSTSESKVLYLKLLGLSVLYFEQ